jgi:preprotein translocase subunit SecE
MVEIEQLPRKKIDTYLWALIIILVSAGIVANHYFSNVVWTLRLSGWIVLLCVVIFLVFTTVAGKKLWNFAKEARVELRKVVWPSKDETVRTTMLVAAMVVVVALILWGVDAVLLWIVNLLSGVRG